MDTPKKSNSSSDYDLRVKITNESHKEALKNIAERSSVSIPTLVKTNLHKITDSFPDYMKKPLD